MRHNSTTAVTVEPIEADGRGSIAGFRVTCSACGFTFTTSLRSIADADGREHVAYMAKLEAGKIRRPKLANVGWGKLETTDWADEPRAHR